MTNATETFNCMVGNKISVDVKVVGDVWRCRWKNQHIIDFSTFRLPSELVSIARGLLRKRLSRSGPSAICAVKCRQKCGRGLAPDGGVSVYPCMTDPPPSGASPLPHLIFSVYEGGAGPYSGA